MARGAPARSMRMVDTQPTSHGAGVCEGISSPLTGRGGRQGGWSPTPRERQAVGTTGTTEGKKDRRMAGGAGAGSQVWRLPEGQGQEATGRLLSGGTPESPT